MTALLRWRPHPWACLTTPCNFCMVIGMKICRTKFHGLILTANKYFSYFVFISFINSSECTIIIMLSVSLPLSVIELLICIMRIIISLYVFAFLAVCTEHWAAGARVAEWSETTGTSGISRGPPLAQSRGEGVWVRAWFKLIILTRCSALCEMKFLEFSEIVVLCS